jgi:hypothetical protein
MAGMSVHAYLNEKDQFKQNMMLSIANRFMDLQEQLDQNRATMISNAVMKGLSGK